MTRIGTLFAFVVVCAAVIMLRIKRPEAHRPFRVPFGYLFPVLGILSCLYLMLSLPAVTWVRFLVWLDLGMMIYWFYGRTHSPLADRAEQAAQARPRAAGNFVTILGALGLFNGFFMTVLGYMTEFGITTEAPRSGTRSTSRRTRRTRWASPCSPRAPWSSRWAGCSLGRGVPPPRPDVSDIAGRRVHSRHRSAPVAPS